jgi:serine/threonine-protein kinase RsbT
VRFPVATPADANRARQEARALAAEVGFDIATTEMVALATSELATNLVRYAVRGDLSLIVLNEDGTLGIEVESRDAGPGIADLGRALEDGFSTGGGLGNGLPGVRRLMDDFEITSGSDGTHVKARKWRRAR